MKTFIAFSSILFLAVCLGLAIEADPGYVLFAYQTWTIEMPLWFFIIACLLIFLLIYWLVTGVKHFLLIPHRLYTWQHSVKEEKHKHALAEQEKYVKLLQDALHQSDVKLLEQVWKEMPTRLRKKPQILTIYVKGLLQYQQSIRAITVLEKALRKQWQDDFIELYGLTHAQDLAKQLRQLEKWLKQHGESAVLLLALGRIAKANQLWGKARYYLQRSIDLQPTPAAHYEYGTLLEQLGETNTALTVFRQGLEPAID